jgi:hypothetical protein
MRRGSCVAQPLGSVCETGVCVSHNRRHCVSRHRTRTSEVAAHPPSGKARRRRGPVSPCQQRQRQRQRQRERQQQRRRRVRARSVLLRSRRLSVRILQGRLWQHVHVRAVSHRERQLHAWKHVRLRRVLRLVPAVRQLLRRVRRPQHQGLRGPQPRRSAQVVQQQRVRRRIVHVQRSLRLLLLTGPECPRLTASDSAARRRAPPPIAPARPANASTATAHTRRSSRWSRPVCADVSAAAGRVARAGLGAGVTATGARPRSGPAARAASRAGARAAVEHEALSEQEARAVRRAAAE